MIYNKMLILPFNFWGVISELEETDDYCLRGLWSHYVGFKPL